MKQKIIDFKSKIRRAQIESIFSKNRQQILRMNQMQSNASMAQLNAFHQQRNMFAMNRREIQMGGNLEGFDQAQHCSKWDQWDVELVKIAESGNYEAYENSLYRVYQSLKKIMPLHRTQRQKMIDFFLKKFLLVNIVNIFVQISSKNLPNGLLQNISKTSISILELCIHLQPTTFTQEIFINSNILPFLALTLSSPPFNEEHISKLLIIVIHMVIISAAQTKELFRMLNSSGSNFNCGAIFYNIMKMKLKPESNTSINFIIFMKYYLLQIENQANLSLQAQSQQNSAQKAKIAKQIIGLTQQQLNVAIQLTIQAVNFYSYIDFSDNEFVYCLQESLQVMKILVELFDVSQQNKWRIKYDRIIELLSFKNCPREIHQKVLVIIDHFIYTDYGGNQTIYFVQSCNLIDRLWGLRKDFQTEVLNIFCNLALQKNIRINLQSYAHQIFLNLKFQRSEMIYTFIYNWFSIHKFQIQSNLEKLVVEELLFNSEQIDEVLIEKECLIWFHLCKNNNNIEVPQKVILSQNKWAQKLRQELEIPQEQEL